MTEVAAPAVAVLRDGLPLGIVEGDGSALAVVWPGTGSRFRSMHRLELRAGAATVPLRHESEAVYFVASGGGRAGPLPVRPRTMVYVPRRTPYRLEADTDLLAWGGPCPPDLSLYGEGRPLDPEGEGDGPVRVFDAEGEGVPLPVIGRRVRLVVWPGVGAEVATMNFAILDPGEENTPHVHAEADDTIAILEGEGSIDDLESGATHPFSAGDVVFVRAGVPHKVKADAGVPIVSAGGPCPPDLDMLRRLGLT